MTYKNKWMPPTLLDELHSLSGTLLDVGGGAAPHYRATHILDIQPFEAERLRQNTWGRPSAMPGPPPHWMPENYTVFDLCGGNPWPFADHQFDWGLCSHCLEDLRDPLPAVRELQRVCRQVIIVTPSRLLEQTRGIDHPRYCGFFHHPWMVYQAGNQLRFRRKTSWVEMPGCHFNCPWDETLTLEAGVSVFRGSGLIPVEEAFWSETEEAAEYRSFLQPYRGHENKLFEVDPHRRKWRFKVFWIKQLFSLAQK
jgi:SAM-dependent methyltransferase